tara:strand:- start:41 stop:379 length:339 start_codon:yes stop_codon:yes gene_type:complete
MKDHQLKRLAMSRNVFDVLTDEMKTRLTTVMDESDQTMNLMLGMMFTKYQEGSDLLGSSNAILIDFEKAMLDAENEAMEREHDVRPMGWTEAINEIRTRVGKDDDESSTVSN